MNKKPALLIHFLVLTGLFTFSACNKKGEVAPVPPDPSSYAYVKADQRTVVLEDNFADNKNEWPLVSETDFSFQVVNNVYRLQSNTNSSAASYKYITLDYSKDFEIEMELKSTAPASFFSFAFNLSNSFAHTVSFTYDSKKLTYTRLQNGIFTDLVNETGVTGLEAGKTIKLTIRKMDQEMQLFVNEKLIGKSAYVTGNDTDIAFRTGHQTLTEVDKFRLTYLNMNN